MSLKEKVLRIMELALEINPPDIEDVGEKRTAVFVEYAPHCTLLSVRIHKDGWKAYYPYEEWQAWMPKDEENLDNIIKRLEEIREEYRNV